MTVIDIAKDILCMQNEILYLREEVKRLENIERKYDNLLNSSIEYSKEMSGQVMELIINKGNFKDKR